MAHNPLAGKKILITAGPTWVAIDDVRVISNISSGELGALLVREAERNGMHVDLFLGPATALFSFGKKTRLKRFRYFEDLLGLVQEETSRKKYDIILHAAAVSDYFLEPVRGKISSLSESLVLKMRRAPKIIQIMRRQNPGAFLVMFKLESLVTDAVLLKRAMEAMRKIGADLVVANRFAVLGRYRGFILGSKNILSRTTSKRALARDLMRIIKEKVSGS